jgi:hypothetical protein
MEDKMLYGLTPTRLAYLVLALLGSLPGRFPSSTWSGQAR